MIKIKIKNKKGFIVNKSYEGETIEEKIERVLNNGEPINDIAEPIYTDRNDGVLPEYDIRTDRFDIALDGIDVIEKSKNAKREEIAKGKETKETKVEVIDQPTGDDNNK